MKKKLMKENAQESLIQSSYNSEGLHIQPDQNKSSYNQCEYGTSLNNKFYFVDVTHSHPVSDSDSSYYFSNTTFGANPESDSPPFVIRLCVTDLGCLGIGLNLDVEDLRPAFYHPWLREIAWDPDDRKSSRCLITCCNEDGTYAPKQAFDLIFDTDEGTSSRVTIPAPMVNIVRIELEFAVSVSEINGYCVNMLMNSENKLGAFNCNDYKIKQIPQAPWNY